MSRSACGVCWGCAPSDPQDLELELSGRNTESLSTRNRGAGCTGLVPVLLLPMTANTDDDPGTDGRQLRMT